jgi:hypothetical protein
MLFNPLSLDSLPHHAISLYLEPLQRYMHACMCLTYETTHEWHNNAHSECCRCLLIFLQVQFAGRRMSVSKFTNMLFEYDYDMRWWCLLIVVGYLVFFRVTSILALKYVNFLRR